MVTGSLGCRNVFESKFDELQENVFEANRDVFDEEIFTKAAFVRTVTVMRASVHPPLDNENISLVPLADQVYTSEGLPCTEHREASLTAQ